MIKTAAIVTAVMLGMLVSLPAIAQDELDQEPRPGSWVQDAQLNDVFFINPLLGWAVGEQGTVLRTVDGGRRWKVVSTAKARQRANSTVMAGIDEPDRQYDSIDIANQILRQRQKDSRQTELSDSVGREIQCRLNSVHFINEQTGWVAGGYDLPQVDRSRGVVLQTRDGGRTWRAVSGLLIPAITRIQFSDAQNGWAVGDASNLYPGGIFTTTDGGHTWSSASSSGESLNSKLDSYDWVDATQTAMGHLAINRTGVPAQIRNSTVSPARVDLPASGKLNRLAMLDANRGIAAGNRGTLFKTTDGGSSWDSINVGADLSLFDFQAIGQSPDKVWIAGTPGSTLISLDKETLTARAHPTPIQTPIQKIYFIDSQRGWAVGSLGTILSTRDGGESWILQRGNFRNVAVLGIADDPRQIPHEAFAQLSAEQDLVSAGLVLNGPANDDSVRQSVTRLGVSIHHEYEPGDRAVQLKELVRDLRMLRPVIVILAGDFQTQMLVSEAVQLAANSEAHADQLQLCGLKPWQVERFYLVDRRGEISLDFRKVLPRFGQSLGDSVALSKALVNRSLDFDSAANYRGLPLNGSLPSSTNGFLKGLASNKLARRSGSRPRGNLEIIRHLAGKHAVMELLLNARVSSPGEQSQWRKTVQQATLSLQPEVAGIWLMQLAEGYSRRGNAQLAASTLEALITLYPKHPLSFSATTWLIEMYASSELANVEFHKFQSILDAEQGSVVQAGNFESVRTRVQVAGGPPLELWVPKSILKQAQSDVQSAGHSSGSLSQELTAKGFLDLRLQRASQLIMRLRQRDPDIAASKSIKMTEAKISNRLTSSVMDNVFRQQLRSSSPDLRLTARRELALLGNREAASLNPWRIQRVTERPALDGRLDDSIWNQVSRLSRSFPRREHPDMIPTETADQVFLGYDDEFIFIAARCQQIKGQVYKPAPRPTERDPDLDRMDRLRIRFDTDRDYETAYEIEVDFRGWVRENCAGGSGWNPDCYVNQSLDESSWSVEIAIPRNELTAEKFRAGTAWAIRFDRLSYDGTPVWSSSKPAGATERKRLEYAAGRYEILLFSE